jgi:hypothetical protein
VSKLRFRGLLLLGFRSFLFERRKEKFFFIVLARLIVLFRVGRDQLFLGLGFRGFLLGFRRFWFL